MRERPRRSQLVAAGVLAVVMVASAAPGATSAADEWTGAEKEWPSRTRTQAPEDRFAMAGGCYAIRAGEGGYVIREGDGFAATGGETAVAEPFHFQATDLGSYLLYGSAEDFLAASEGLIGEAAYGITRSTPGATAGGVVLEQTDAAADAAARSPANRATGRGASVVAAEEPSHLADWTIAEAGEAFSIVLDETEQALAVDDAGDLELVPADEGGVFAFELTEGCAEFPEIELNVDGPVVGGETSFQEVRGYLDAHLHMMAFEFLGGRARCGRPWHRFGVAHALVDCPDHEPGGFGAVLEGVVSHGNPDGRHHTDGWPTFEGWPKHDSLTHEQIYYKWLERSWRGGLRMFVNLLVDNGQLCQVYPYKRNSCNEMDGVRLQAERIRELEAYIDAQNGGPGQGWFRIVEDPFEARRVMNDGRLAVVLGIEVSVPLDCGLTLDMPHCDLDDVEEGLDEVYELGVRQMELVNKFDNAFSGVTGDPGATGVIVNTGNFGETGRFWQMETCTEEDGDAHDKHQHNVHDDSGAPDDLTGQGSLAGGILALAGRSGAAPVYPEGPHCNILGLSDLGEEMIRGMVERGMIFDPDHMSARARTQALDLLGDLGYSGVVSSHSWADDTIYPRIYELGGVVTPMARNSTGFVDEWRKHREWADERFYFGFGYGADTNGFASQGGPRGANVENPVTYPFEGFGGVEIDPQQSGTRTYDINADGVDHYGLYPDWIEDLRVLAGEEIIEDMVRGPEAYLQMWERAIGITGDSCRDDVDDLTPADFRSLEKGMTTEDVLWALGQSSSRVGAVFTYCAPGLRTATLEFDQDGRLSSWHIRPDHAQGKGPESKEKDKKEKNEKKEKDKEETLEPR